MNEEEEQMELIKRLTWELRGEVDKGMVNLNRIKEKAHKIEEVVDEIRATVCKELTTNSATMEELAAEMKEKGYVFVWNIGEPDDNISFESPEDFVIVDKALNLNGELMPGKNSLWVRKEYAEENLRLPYNY